MCDSVDLKVFVCGFLTAYDTLLKFMSKVRKKDYFWGGWGGEEQWTKFIE